MGNYTAEELSGQAVPIAVSRPLHSSL